MVLRLDSIFCGLSCCSVLHCLAKAKNWLARWLGSNTGGTCRLLLDLEGISETVIVVLIGGPSALVWMIGSLIIMMIVNSLIVYFRKPTSSCGKVRLSSALYSLVILFVTIYTTILFQTKQAAVFLLSHSAPLSTVSIMMAGVALMLVCRRFVVAIYALSALAAMVYVIGVIGAIIGAPMSIQGAVHLMFGEGLLESKAMLCGYVGGCAMGSYMFNVKSSRRMTYNNPSPLSASLYIACEYAITVSMCTLTGLAVVLSGAYKAGLSTSEFAAPGMVLGNIIGTVGMLVPIFAIVIVLDETYYSCQYWKSVISRVSAPRLFKNFKFKALNMAAQSVPLVITICVMLLGTGVIDVDVMPFIHVADQLTGAAIFLTILSPILRRSSSV